MSEIIPAILTDDPAVFKQQVAAAKNFGAKTVQIDFTDDQFVPSKTLLPDDLDSFVISQSELMFEGHLMVVEPEKYFSTLYALGFKRIAVHIETLQQPETAIELARELGVEIGFAINPDTDLSKIEPYMNGLDFILFMTVVPGEQGRPFIESVLEKIYIDYQRKFKREHNNVAIEVDGGVNAGNIKAVAASGAERIVVGSAIWRTPNPAEVYNQLKKLANT